MRTDRDGRTIRERGEKDDWEQEREEYDRPESSASFRPEAREKREIDDDFDGDEIKVRLGRNANESFPEGEIPTGHPRRRLTSEEDDDAKERIDDDEDDDDRRDRLKYGSRKGNPSDNRALSREEEEEVVGDHRESSIARPHSTQEARGECI